MYAVFYKFKETLIYYGLRGEIQRNLTLELQTLQLEYDKLKSLYNLSVKHHRTAENLVWETENKFSRLFEDGPFGVVLVNSSGRFISVNDAFCNMTGYTELELQNLSFIDITHPNHSKNDYENIQKLLKHEISSYNTEKRYIRKDGKEIWASVTANANFNKDGQFLYLIAVIEEITLRKNADAVLNKVTERLELATKSANIGIWDWDVQSNLLVWDNQMYNLYGYHDIFQVGYETWSGSLYPEDKAMAEQDLNKAILGDGEFNTEYRILWPDNAVHWIKATAKVFYDSNSAPIRLVGVNYDITEQRNNTEALAASKAKLEAALASMTDAVFISDALGNFIEVNDAFATFHKFKDKDAYFETLKEDSGVIEFYYPNGQLVPVDQRAMQRALRGEIAKNAEYKLKRNDTGESWSGSFSFAPILDQAGKIVGSVVAARDITEHKEIEAALVRSRDLLLNLARLVPGVIYQYRLNPDGSSAFPYSSPGMFDIYEVTPEGVKYDATPVFGRLHPEDYNMVSQTILNSAQTLETFYCEFRVVLPKQGLRWRWSQAHPERLANGGTLWHGIISDITERKQAEILLKEKSDEIEKQNKEYHQLNEELKQTNEELQEAKDHAEQSDQLKTAFCRI
ncbi:MAG: PAS domain S-box protein [Bacteroidales bacterium]|nr:PAS domain S-box protein [Bacteroidales bacterium]